MNVFDEFLQIAVKFEGRGIPYALVGGVAMAFHSEPRFTEDVDILVPDVRQDEVAAVLGELSYFESSEPWTFRNTNLTLRRFARGVGEVLHLIDVLVAHEPRHLEAIERALIAETGNLTVRVARKEDLIWMKSVRNSAQDQVDIERLRRDTH